MAKNDSRILVVDDEEAVRYMVTSILEKDGYTVEPVVGGIEAINIVQKKKYDVALLDVKMPKIDGIEVLRFIKENFPDMEVVMLTGEADIKTAVTCMRLGAYDYLTKPYSNDELLTTIERTLERKRLRLDNLLLQSKISQLEGSSDIIGNSAALKKVVDLAARVAPTESTVLIQGASGTGKELIANLVYKNSTRKDSPFVAINCASIPDSLMESELFGHEKGAFTDARSMKQGLVQIANGGTLFLDEIGEVSPVIQPKLLRFIQTGEFRRVGGNTVLTSDVRIISATNKNLVEEVRTGRFREDLLYRLNVITIEIPSLRERKEDIPLLVDWFLKRKFKKKSEKNINVSALEILMKYDWPGNIRELENVLERAAILSTDDMIQPQDISLPLKMGLHGNMFGETSVIGSSVEIKEVEKQHIAAVLKNLDGNKPEAAKILGISLKTLYTKIQQYQIGTN